MLQPFHTLWWNALGRHYELPQSSGQGECASCGDAAMLYERTGDGLCGACFTIGAKKAMASNPAKKAGPNGSHFVVAGADRFIYGGDLARPANAAQDVEIVPASNALLRFCEAIRTPPQLPAFFVHMDRSYRPIIRSARPSLSPRAMHFNAPSPSVADAPLINKVTDLLVAAFEGAPPPAFFTELEKLSVPLFQGPLAGDAYAAAVARLREITNDERPSLAPLYPAQGPWPIEPETSNWEWLKAVVRYIRTGELQ